MSGGVGLGCLPGWAHQEGADVSCGGGVGLVAQVGPIAGQLLAYADYV